ncbi:MAG: alpha/beta fold hydrolase [Pseudonocardiaceae bacterium]|nr:alpha/beta fold hydrolase [Pseudonocardiaceae bacterium]
MKDLTEHTIEAGGYATHYWEVAPEHDPEGTVVLVHEGAFGADARTSWAGLMPLLGDRYRVLAPDLLGFGDTDKVVYFDRSPHAFRAAHLAAFCDAAGVGEGGAHFVGHSLGGSLVLRALARESPVLPARSGVSISGSGGPWRSQWGVEQLGRFDGTEDDVRRVLDLMVDDYPGFEEAVRLRYANTRKPGHVQACLAARLKHPSMDRPAADDGWPSPLRACPVPVLVVSGARDPLLDSGWAEHFEGVSPRVRVEQLDAKHAPNLDRPDAVAALLLDFFAGERDLAAAARQAGSQ